jgi:hypothetical protein
MSKPAPTAVLNVELPEELMQQLRDFAKKNRRSLKSEVQEALRCFLNESALDTRLTSTQHNVTELALDTVRASQAPTLSEGQSQSEEVTDLVIRLSNEDFAWGVIQLKDDAQILALLRVGYTPKKIQEYSPVFRNDPHFDRRITLIKGFAYALLPKRNENRPKMNEELTNATSPQ